MATFQSQIDILARAICTINTSLPSEDDFGEKNPISYETTVTPELTTSNITFALSDKNATLTLGSQAITLEYLGYQVYNAIKVDSNYIHFDGSINQTPTNSEIAYEVPIRQEQTYDSQQTGSVSPLTNIGLSAVTTAIMG